MKMEVRYMVENDIKVWTKYVPSYFYGCLDFAHEVGDVKVISESWV